MLIRFLRLRPFLWPVPVVVVAYVGSFWLERGLSYDDGGLGGLVFFVVNTLGVVGLWCARLLFALLSEPMVDPTLTGILLFPVVAAAGCLPYVALDRLSERWIESRVRTVDPSRRSG